MLDVDKSQCCIVLHKVIFDVELYMFIDVAMVI